MPHGRQVNASAEDRLLKRMREAGLIDARRVATRSTILGAIAYYQAIAPFLRLEVKKAEATRQA